MKLQLKVFSGSWWATENKKQMQKSKGQSEGFFTVLQDKQSALTQSHNKVVESIGLTNSVEK